MTHGWLSDSIPQLSRNILRLALFFGMCGLFKAGNCADPPSAERGYQLLRTAHYLPPDFDDEVFNRLWENWPEPQRSQAEAANPAARRKLMFEHYGLVEDPADTGQTEPALGYSRGEKKTWVMTCLACHAGQVEGQVIAGLPNSNTALQTLTEDVIRTKASLAKPFSHLDLGSLRFPLNTTNGTSNSVIFGVLLGAYRNPDMSVDLKKPQPYVVHHDVDAPPFWNVKYKTSLYCDGFSPKTPRPLMQFMLLPKNDRETIYGWEDDFRHILAWIESVEPPKYTGSINQELAQTGKTHFEAHCSRCHGTYGEQPQYEQQTIALDEIGTDPVRLKSLTPHHRQWMKSGWMSRYGEDPVIIDPQGYVAPPLHGIWASAPYLHNGSVPTLWHLLHPNERPVVWKRTPTGYDHEKMGLEIESFAAVPKGLPPRDLRSYFNTKAKGKSAAGHPFVNELSETEKQAVLEYLKTL